MYLLPEPYIREFGGKAGAFFYLQEWGGFEQHMLPLDYLAPKENFSKIAHKFNDWNRRHIIRSTHPNDHEGLVDILHTEHRVQEKKEFPRVIKEIRKEANHPSVFEYSEYEGQPYNGKIGIMIQPQGPHDRGNIIEHPHKRNVFLIDYVEPTMGIDDNVYTKVIVEDGDINMMSSYGGPKETTVQQIVELYRKIRETEWIEPDMSFQMEFGVNHNNMFPDKEYVLFYQARPFKKFESSPFKITSPWKFECYGITPKEGIVLPIRHSNTFERVSNEEEPFAWIPHNLRGKFPAIFHPKNMAAFLPVGNRVNFLEHNTFKWIRKADISITCPTSCYIWEKMESDNIRIISNGIEFKVEEA
jgi:hypothetical protein